MTIMVELWTKNNPQGLIFVYINPCGYQIPVLLRIALSKFIARFRASFIGITTASFLCIGLAHRII